MARPEADGPGLVLRREVPRHGRTPRIVGQALVPQGPTLPRVQDAERRETWLAVSAGLGVVGLAWLLAAIVIVMAAGCQVDPRPLPDAAPVSIPVDAAPDASTCDPLCGVHCSHLGLCVAVCTLDVCGCAVCENYP